MKRLIIASFIVSMLFYPATGAQAADKAKHLTPVPDSVVQLLAAGDLKKAIFEMRDLPKCSKIAYLMRNANNIVLFEIEGKPSKADAHKVYQNVAVSYHNLYLFLKAHGIEQSEFYDEADRYYGKGRRAGTHLHKADCEILRASLHAAGGDVEKARKEFRKIDELMMRGDFESAEYLASYHAAVGDVEEAIEDLRSAFALDPKRTNRWLAISDDFVPIADDPRFVALKTSFAVKSGKGELILSVPACEEPRLQMTGGTDPFTPLGYTKKARRQLNANRKN